MVVAGQIATLVFEILNLKYRRNLGLLAISLAGLILIVSFSGNTLWKALSGMMNMIQGIPQSASTPQLPSHGPRLLLLMIDGLGIRPFQTALEAGKLPHIQALMAARPTSSLHAISTFTGSYTSNNVSTIFDALLCVKSAGFASNALNNQASVFIYENTHMCAEIDNYLENMAIS